MTVLPHLLLLTLFLAVGGGIVYLLLRFVGSRSPFVHRTAWAVVLLLGVLWVRIPIEIPVVVQEISRGGAGDAEELFVSDTPKEPQVQRSETWGLSALEPTQPPSFGGVPPTLGALD
jgi:hypothetical protein